MRGGRRIRWALTALGGAATIALALLPGAASAHPLGNFTINHLSQVRISQGSVEVQYILDQAEIPTFQEIQRFDRDGDGAISGPERGALLERKLAEISPDLQLTADGRAVTLGAPRAPSLAFPPGQGGLSLTRVEASFVAAIPPGAHRVELRDETYGDRVGWKAIEVLPGEGTDVRSSVPASDPTGGLRAYPVDLLQSPPDQRDASFAVSEGSGRVSAPDGEDVGPVTTDRAQDGFAGALTSGNDHGALILLLLGSAFIWGALHALSPGHGKTMVAGYLAGSRGRPKDAALLGLAVTITHTFAVFALGLITLAASAYVLPEDLYPWLGIASGAMVIAIGLWAIWTRLRRWRAMRAQHDHGHHHMHRHVGHAHTHEPSEAPITTRSLIALGISGGIVPCPSALVVLVAAISQHRLGLGLALILAFSVGLAATLTGVGLAVLHGGRLLERLRPERRLFGGRVAGVLPALSATLIVVAGTLITLRAIPQLG
ncbi:MAG TPA: sulfite exporter TauE/SafE family protein [Solirubrobacterales bacterium]